MANPSSRTALSLQFSCESHLEVATSPVRGEASRLRVRGAGSVCFPGCTSRLRGFLDTTGLEGGVGPLKGQTAAPGSCSQSS